MNIFQICDRRRGLLCLKDSQLAVTGFREHVACVEDDRESADVVDTGSPAVNVVEHSTSYLG